LIKKYHLEILNNIFEVGDKVKLKNIKSNRYSILLYKRSSYTIESIIFLDGKVSKFILKEYPISTWYYKNFEIDTTYNRKRKILKIKTKMK